ncbi:MAG TPA: MxaK protein [Burkholderiales bacterium]|jgi:mxaK protein|nr:MxaK protein [Burkholderiales bacterium]
MSPRRWIPALVLAALAALAGHDGLQLRHAQRVNTQIAAGHADRTRGSAPQIAFANAYALAAAGHTQQALALYQQAADSGDAALRADARYNTANLYLRRGYALKRAGQPDQALPLVELAKQNYRDLLRADSADWDARYNLERALRLFPDPENSDAEAKPPPLNSRRAQATMRGIGFLP